MYTLEFSTNEEFMKKTGTKMGYSILRDTIFRIERPLKMKRRGDRIYLIDYKNRRRYVLIPSMVTDHGRYCIIETKQFFYVLKKF